MATVKRLLQWRKDLLNGLGAVRVSDDSTHHAHSTAANHDNFDLNEHEHLDLANDDAHPGRPTWGRWRPEQRPRHNG